MKNCRKVNILCYNVAMNVLSKLSVKIIIGILMVGLVCASAQSANEQTAFEQRAFIAGDHATVQIYEMDAHGDLQEAKAIPRGTEVTLPDEKPMETAEGSFLRIDMDSEDSGNDAPAGGADRDEIDAAEADAANLDAAEADATGTDAGMIIADVTTAEEMCSELKDISASEPPLYVKPENLVSSKGEVVQETELFVRTPVTIYRSSKGPEIAGFAPKGTRLEVTGFAGLDKNGQVAKYKVRPVAGTDGEAADKKDGDADSTKDAASPEGYVYSKYLVRSQEEADKNYNKNGEYDKAKKAKFSMNLHGGKATGLDYYPFERTKIKGNEFCREARGMYLNYAAALNYKPYIKIIKQTKCNAVVIDIKSGNLSYKSPVAKKLSPKAYKKAHADLDEYKAAVQIFKDAGVYTIGRITCFNDFNYAKDHPEDCIKTSVSGSRWPSAYSRDMWYYNVALAVEAVKLMGFNEIQFDYVRFPEAAYEMSLEKRTDFRNQFGETKAQAIQNFCFYAADQIHEAGAYFSVDVFGECSNGYVTAYGQYWPAISNVVDAISSMPYTDHFGNADTWSHPKAIMKVWAKGAARDQKKIPTPAAARTWITGYNTPFWAPQVKYDKKKLKQQVDALYEAGLDGGFIPWHSASPADTYRMYKGIWDYER